LQSFEEANNLCDSKPYHYPEVNICIVKNLCSVGCIKAPHDENCLMKHFNQAIESILLNEQLSIIGDMKHGLVKNNILTDPYILDIDLDYFHTRQAIKPHNPTTFYSLIKKAEAITIATEPEYINEWAQIYKYDTQLNAEMLFNDLKDHIYNALC